MEQLIQIQPVYLMRHRVTYNVTVKNAAGCVSAATIGHNWQPAPARSRQHLRRSVHFVKTVRHLHYRQHPLRYNRNMEPGNDQYCYGRNNDLYFYTGCQVSAEASSNNGCRDYKPGYAYVYADRSTMPELYGTSTSCNFH